LYFRYNLAPPQQCTAYGWHKLSYSYATNHAAYRHLGNFPWAIIQQLLMCIRRSSRSNKQNYFCVPNKLLTITEETGSTWKFSDIFLGRAPFESRPQHPQSWLRFFVRFFSTSEKVRTLHPASFPIHGSGSSSDSTSYLHGYIYTYIHVHTHAHTYVYIQIRIFPSSAASPFCSSKVLYAQQFVSIVCPELRRV
jgi:hypothetical protein